MRRTALAVVAVVSLALALAAPATAKSGQATATAAKEAAEHRRILAYWTPERMAAAKPRDIVVPLGTKPASRAKPTKPGGGGSASSPSANSLGATWSFGGAVAETTGKVFFTLGGANYVCSGSLVQSNDPNVQIVSTAGHCAHEGDGSGRDGYATNFTFRPGWDGTQNAPVYTASSANLHATTNWQSSGAAHGAYPDDAAFARVTGSGVSAAPPAVTFTGGTGDRQVYAFGYPAARKYKGNTLTYCSGITSFRYDGDDTLSIGCDMTGGSSGGPWFESFANGSGVQTSVNSYGYSGVTRMFGPVFDSLQEGAAFKAAGGVIK